LTPAWGQRTACLLIFKNWKNSELRQSLRVLEPTVGCGIFFALFLKKTGWRFTGYCCGFFASSVNLI